MFEVVNAFLLDFIQVLKVFIPMYCVFDIVGDILWR